MRWPRLWGSRERGELVRLRESEARYRRMADHAVDLIVEYDMQGVVRYVSPSVIDIVGLPPAEVVGHDMHEFAHPDDADHLRQRLRALGEGRALESVDRELRMRRPDGTWRWVQGNPAPIQDADGRLIGFVTIIRDVTERRRLEEKLREGEARFRQLAEQSADMIVRYDTDGNIEYLSPAARRFGLDPDHAVGRNFRDIVPPEDRERNEAFFADLRDGRLPPQGERNVWRAPLEEGRYVDFEGATNPIVEDGKVIGAVATLRDVTDRIALQEALEGKQAEMEQALARLTESEARYRTLADSASDVIVRLDLLGNIDFISPSISQFGYQPDELIGRNNWDFVHPDDRTGKVRAAVAAGRPAPRGDDDEFRLRRADGAWAWVQGSTAGIRDSRGELVGFVVVMRDVTEQRLLKEELRRKESEAQAAVQAKSEFLATMSHEIRTPLTAVVGFAELLNKMAGLPEKARTYVSRIARSGEALASIVNNVLDFSKIEAGQVELRPDPFDLETFADEVIGVVEDAAAAKNLELTRHVAGPPSGKVLADAARLRQVVLNLLTNAVKFTASGRIALDIRHADDTLEVSVTDTGIGIAPEATARLFQRFSQVDSSNARRFGGAGLGLAISRGLIELMGGEIAVESTPDRGSRFWFRVSAPAAGSEPDLVEPDLPGPPAGSRVLVVDDARANRELIVALLSPYDLKVTEAADGLEAVEAARRDPFDLILMDLQMPGLDGIAATRTIRSDSELNRRTPIVAVSASVQPSDIEACRLAGMEDHVGKPISPQELVGKVTQWIGTPRAA